jgi:hypothetical protein
MRIPPGGSSVLVFDADREIGGSHKLMKETLWRSQQKGEKELFLLDVPWEKQSLPGDGVSLLPVVPEDGACQSSQILDLSGSPLLPFVPEDEFPWTSSLISFRNSYFV